MPATAVLTDLDCAAAVRLLAGRLKSAGIKPAVAVILGSGLGPAGDTVLKAGGIAVSYSDVPGMPRTAVAGHSGRLIIGTGQYSGLLLLQGRVHSYEGHSVAAMTFATRLMAAIGAYSLVVSNAAGGIREGFLPGHLMLISGHWTLLHVQETVNSLQQATRELPINRLWCAPLRGLARATPTTLTIHDGVYAMMSGPNYETPAEVRMLQTMNVDAVGMSTIPEALAAAKRGLRVLGVSCITNIASGLSDAVLDHAEVSETALSIESEFTHWLLAVCHRIMEEPVETAAQQQP